MKDYSVLDNMIRMVGDTIKQAFDKGYKQGYEDGIGDGAKSVKSWDKACYEQGLNDAWEAAKWIFNASVDDMMQTFGGVSLWVHYTASEAIAKINECEEKRRQIDDEIQVGDEIENDTRGKAIVLYKEPYRLWHCIYSLGAFSLLKEHQSLWHKTGRHFDQIEEVLKQMQEDKG